MTHRGSSTRVRACRLWCRADPTRGATFHRSGIATGRSGASLNSGRWRRRLRGRSRAFWSILLPHREEKQSPRVNSTGKVPLALFQPGDLAERVGDGGAKAADEDKADRDDVQLCELVGGEGEGDLVEQEARGEERGVDWGTAVGVGQSFGSYVAEETRAGGLTLVEGL